MPTAPAYQLTVDVVTARCRPPRNASAHPWRRTSRDGVVTVERAPGIAGDVAARPVTPEERDERDRLIYEAVVAGGRCRDVGTRFGRSKNSVIGIVDRYRARHGLPVPAPVNDAISSRNVARNAAVVAALRDGATPREAAERCGVSVDVVRGVRTRAVASGALPPPPPPVARRPTLVRSAPVVCAPVDVVRVGLLDVGQGQCRDLGDDRLCCCQPTAGTTSWCLAHLALYTRARRAA